MDVQFDHTDHLRDEVEELAEVIRQGGETEIGPTAALRNLGVILAAVRSTEEHRLVEIAEVIGEKALT